MSTAKQVKIAGAILALLVAIALLCYAWLSAGEQLRIARETEAARNVEAARLAEEERVARLEALIRQIRTSVDNEERANRAAIIQADAELRELFVAYCARTSAFSEEVTTLKYQAKLAWAKGVDAVRGTQQARTLVEQLFGEVVVTDARLRDDVLAVVRHFQRDLEANRNQMLTRVAHDFRLAKVGVVPAREASEASQEAIRQVLLDRISSAGTNAASRATLSIAGSMAVGYTAELVAARAVGLAAGYAAQGAAIGTGAGTAAAPGLGTSVGIAVGLVAGYAVDRVASEHIRAQVEGEVCNALEQTRQLIWSDQNSGLQSLLSASVEQNRTTHLSSLAKIANEGRI